MERPRFGYKERAEAVRIEIEKQEKRQAEELARRKKTDRELAERRHIAAEILAQLDTLEVSARLEEINRDIWNNRGLITLKEIKDAEDGIVVEKRFLLHADVPVYVEKETTPVMKRVYGRTWWSSMDGERLSDWDSWHDEKIGEKITGREITTRDDTLAVTFRLATMPDDTGHARIIDSVYPVPPLVEDISSNVLDLNPSTFQLDAVRRLVEHGLRFSSLKRIENPIERCYEHVQEQIAAINARMGEVELDPHFSDPTPLWRRLFR